MRRGWLVACTALALGCGATERAPKLAWAADGRPMTVIELEDATTWPFEIAEISVHLDGAAVIEHQSPPGDPTKWAFEAPFEGLPRGDHTLQVRVKARYASTRMDPSADGCAVLWRDSRTFTVGAKPVGVRIMIETDDVTRPFVDRLDVGIALLGARQDRGVHASGPRRELLARGAACRDDGPLPFDDRDLSRGRAGGPLRGGGPALLR